MISENQRCKMIALLKSLKNINVLIFRTDIPEYIFITFEDGFWNVNPKY